jgi:hypothetical protein
LFAVAKTRIMKIEKIAGRLFTMPIAVPLKIMPSKILTKFYEKLIEN